APDNLAQAELDVAERPGNFRDDLMAHQGQLSRHYRRQTLLQMHDAGSPATFYAKAGPVQGRLGVEFVVHKVDQHLQVALRLHEIGHYPEWSVERTDRLTGQHARNDSVTGPFAWSQGVRVVGVGRESRAPVVDGET